MFPNDKISSEKIKRKLSSLSGFVGGERKSEDPANCGEAIWLIKTWIKKVMRKVFHCCLCSVFNCNKKVWRFIVGRTGGRHSHGNFYVFDFFFVHPWQLFLVNNSINMCRLSPLVFTELQIMREYFMLRMSSECNQLKVISYSIDLTC